METFVFKLMLHVRHAAGKSVLVQPASQDRDDSMESLTAIDQMFRERQSLIASGVPCIGRFKLRRLLQYSVYQNGPAILPASGNRAGDFDRTSFMLRLELRHIFPIDSFQKENLPCQTDTSYW